MKDITERFGIVQYLFVDIYSLLVATDDKGIKTYLPLYQVHLYIVQYKQAEYQYQCSMYKQVVAELFDKIRVTAGIICKYDHGHHDTAKQAGDQRAVDLIKT